MNTTDNSHPDPEPLVSLTLKWAGAAGDGKRALVEAEENDGWHDLRIEVDTDDCDSKFAKAAMQSVIDRTNDYERLVAANDALNNAIIEAIRTANGRDDEWGERAVECFDILRAAVLKKA